MAGSGTRFKKIGVVAEKYRIIAEGRSLFDWSLHSLANFKEAHYCFIAQQAPGLKEFILDATKESPGHHSIHFVDTITRGQAESALIGLESIENKEDPILIYNIDTYVEPSALKPGDIRGDGWLPAFKADGDRWSFVDFNDEFQVHRVTEKVRISDYGTVGLYYFSSAKLYQHLYETHPWSKEQERYVAPLYQSMIERNEGSVYTTVLSPSSVHVLGTPEDLDMFSSSWRTENEFRSAMS